MGTAESDSARADFPVDLAMGKESADSDKAVKVSWRRSHVRQRAELTVRPVGQATEHHIAPTSGMAVKNTRCMYCASGLRWPCVQFASLILSASGRELALPTVGMEAVTLYINYCNVFPVVFLSCPCLCHYLLGFVFLPDHWILIDYPCLEDRARRQGIIQVSEIHSVYLLRTGQ
jgi:hypothetical protein